jgi:hypothetical protein
MKAQQKVFIHEEEASLLHEPLIEVLDANILVLTHRNLKFLIDAWEKNDQYKDAIFCLYQSINSPREEFLCTLKGLLDECKSRGKITEGMRNSFRILDAISLHSTGNIHPNDILYKQCAQVSDISDPERMRKVGEYLKNSANSYLKEHHHQMYQIVESEINPKARGLEAEVANDFVQNDTPSSSVSLLETSQACKLDSVASIPDKLSLSPKPSPKIR